MQRSWLTRRTVAWAGFDVASSVYFGVAPAVLMPLFFRELFASETNPTAAWGMTAAFAVLASSAAALFAASVARRIPRFSILIVSAVGLVFSLTVMSLNPGTSAMLAVLAFVAAQSFYFAATTIYESYLPELSSLGDRQKLSAFGWSVGYLGGIMAIVVLLNIVSSRPADLELLEVCFGALAILSAVLFAGALALMWRVGFGQVASGSAVYEWQGVLSTIRHWRSHRSVFRLLFGTMLVQVGVTVVVTFAAPILVTRSGQTLEDLLWLLLLIHVVSVPSTVGWTWLMGRISRVAPMAVLLACWGVVLLLLAFASGPWMPILTIAVIGCCLGATNSALRGFLAESLRPGTSGAFFGLFTVTGRFAAALGPALYSGLTLVAGERVSLLIILLVLSSGAAFVLLYLLGRPVDDKRSQSAS